MPLIKFPEARQATGYDCGAAAIQAMLYFYGVEAREDYLVEILGSKDQGTLPTSIANFLQGDLGFKVHAGRMTLAEVKGWIDQGIPVLLLIQAWKDETDYANDPKPPARPYEDDWEDGHYVVAVGYDDERGILIVEEPSLYDNRGFIPYDEMDARWHDRDKFGRPWEHFGLVVLDREPQYNAEALLRVTASASRVAARWLAGGTASPESCVEAGSADEDGDSQRWAHP